MAYILLNKGYLATVDDEDFEKVSRFQWVADVRDRIVYVARVSKKGEPKRLHELILVAPPGLVVDHIDGNGLNNRRSNLRVVTNSVNIHNRHGLSRRNTSSFTGVGRHVIHGKWDGLWYSRIMINRKSKSLGYYKTLGEAVEARKKGEARYL